VCVSNVWWYKNRTIFQQIVTPVCTSFIRNMTDILKVAMFNYSLREFREIICIKIPINSARLLVIVHNFLKIHAGYEKHVRRD